MAILYDIFSGDAAGGPIDYTAAIATVSGLTWTGVALDAGTTTRFGVRARDDVSGLDDGNTDATVTIAVDAAGSDATAAPAAVAAAGAASLAGGAVRLSWTYPANAGAVPTGFKVYKGPKGGPVDLGTVLADVPYSQGMALFVGSLATPFAATISTGLADGTTYTFAVAAYNAHGQGPAATVDGASDATAPSNPTNLTATAI